MEAPDSTHPASETEGRQALVALGQLLDRRGLISATDGNFSLRLGPDRILMTPAGRAKGRLKPEEMVVLDQSGAPLSVGSELAPSTEAPMHLEAYRQRADVQAVIHAHPPYTLALTVAGHPIPADILPELVMSLGQVPTLPFALPSSEQGARAIRSAIKEHDALVLQNHGSLTVGSSLEQALVALERLEAVAQVVFLAKLVGDPQRLTEEQLGRLRPDSRA